MINFEDVLVANQGYADNFTMMDLSGQARQGLAIVTCMDSRIDPLKIIGMNPGDVKILRNAGARVTEDVLRTLVLATHLLGVNRVLVMPHTDCRMANGDEQFIHKTIFEKSGIDTSSITFKTVSDQVEALKSDINDIANYKLINNPISVMGAIYDVKSGKLNPVS